MVKYSLIVIILLVVFCNQDPAGEDILAHYRDLGDVEYDTLYPIHKENSYSDLANGYGDNLILGVDGDYEARTLIEFMIPDTGYGQIDSLTLVLKVNNDLDNKEVDFEIRLLETEWIEGEVRWLAASDGIKWQNPGGDYGDTAIYQGSVSKDSIVIELDTEFFDEIRTSYGFILIPNQGGHLGLEAGAARLYLSAGGSQTTFSLSGDSYIVDCHRFPEEYELFLGSGYTFRNFLVFEIDSCYKDLWLARADLEFSILEHRTMRDSIYFRMSALKEEFSGIKSEVIDYQEQYFPIADSMQKIDVLRIVNRWVSEPDSNFGGFLSLYPEDSDLTRLLVDPDSIRLILLIVNKPEGRF